MKILRKKLIITGSLATLGLLSGFLYTASYAAVANTINRIVPAPRPVFVGVSAVGIVSDIQDTSLTLDQASGSDGDGVTTYVFDATSLQEVEDNYYDPLSSSDIKIGDEVIVQGIKKDGANIAHRIILKVERDPLFSGGRSIVMPIIGSKDLNEEASSTDATSTATSTDLEGTSTATTSSDDATTTDATSTNTTSTSTDLIFSVSGSSGVDTQFASSTKTTTPSVSTTTDTSTATTSGDDSTNTPSDPVITQDPSVSSPDVSGDSSSTGNDASADTSGGDTSDSGDSTSAPTN